MSRFENSNFNQFEILSVLTGTALDSYSGANDLIKFTNAINDLNIKGGVLRLAPFKTYNITGALPPIDVSKMGIEGAFTSLQFSNIGSGINAVSLFNSADYTNTYKSSKPALKGIFILGGASASPLAGNGLYIGHATYTENGNFSIEEGAIQGFTNNILFTNNAWRIKFKNFDCRWGNISVPTDLTNFGENMVFEGCMLNDFSSISIGTGEFHFDHCSFDNVTLHQVGDCEIYIEGGHFENPGSTSTGYRYISLEHDNASCFLNNIAVLLNNPGSNFTECLFYVQDTNVNQGLVMNNLKLFNNSYYRPDLGTDAILSLVAGKGRATLHGMATWVNGYGFVISRSMNKLYNGDFETGNTNGWTLAGGTGSTFTVDNTAGNIKQGTYSGKIVAPAGITSAVTQSFPVEPGQHVWSQVWAKYTIAPGGSFQLWIEFFNRDNVDIGSVGYSSLTTSQNSFINFGSIGGIAPKGAAYGIIHYNTVGGTSAETDVWIDDVIVNVI